MKLMLMKFIPLIGVIGMMGATTLRAEDRPARPEVKRQAHRHLTPVFTREEFVRIDTDRSGFVTAAEFEKAYMPDCNPKTCKVEMETAWKTEYPWQDIKTDASGADLTKWLKLAKSKGKTWGGGGDPSVKSNKPK
jgi:hypothetical protein